MGVGILHAGRPAALAGLTALEQAGLKGWGAPSSLNVLGAEVWTTPVRLEGYRFTESRRNIPA